MAYDHKKSLRTLTDEQFSDGTTIDGSRIDKALDDAVEHFNEVPKGDISTRFTKTQYVFGAQPSGYSGTVEVSGANQHFRAYPGTIEGTTFPWNFIANNRHTTAEYNSGGSPAYGNPATPTAGFQNPWRYKGTKVNQVTGSGMATSTNDGQWGSVDWVNDWNSWAISQLTSGTSQPTPRDVANNYQFAWSHSWVFSSPSIMDSVSVLLRTDFPAVGIANTGYYDAPFLFADNSTVVHQTQCLTIQISVDNEFAKEERDLNDVEFMFHNRRMDGYRVCEIPMAASAYTDMLPNSPEYTGGAGTGLHGRLIRIDDLNIPIRKGARVRMAIVIPWNRTVEDGTFSATNPKLSQQGLAGGRTFGKFFTWNDATAGAPIAAPTGGEPMWDWALDGSVTFLEEITR